MRTLFAVALLLASAALLAQGPPPEFAFVTFHELDVVGYRLFVDEGLVLEVKHGQSKDIPLAPGAYVLEAEAYTADAVSARYALFEVTVPAGGARMDCTAAVTAINPPRCWILSR